MLNTSPATLRNLLAPFTSSPTHSPSPAPRSTDAPCTPPGKEPLAARGPPPPGTATYDNEPPTVRKDGQETGGPGSGLGADSNDRGQTLYTSLTSSSTASETTTDEREAPKTIPVPNNSRVDPSVMQRVDPGIGVRNAWQYIPFLATQATNIASSFVSHHLYGPPKKSWGIEMTIFTAIVREASRFSHLSSIHQLRRVLDLGQILPTPKDGIITPVTFKVKKRGLKGFLKQADAEEDGKRELTGEWVVSKRMWKRMQSEHAKRQAAAAANGDFKRSRSKRGVTSPALASPAGEPSGVAAGRGMGSDKVILYLHGGAYFVMSAATHRPLTISVAKYTDCRLFAVNYRLAPETKFPGALHDAVSAYFRLLYDLKISPTSIVVAGDSAGGGLTTALLMYLRDEGYPLPCGAMLLSPWSDLTMSCDSWETNQAYDYLPMPRQDDPLNPVKCYLGEEGLRKYITHPYASPLFGDFHGLPPMLVQAGDAEVLRDEVTLLAHKASLQGVDVSHELYEDCVHVFQAFLFLEASRKALQSMRYFVRHGLPKKIRAAEKARSRARRKQEGGDPRQEREVGEEDVAKDAVDAEIASDAHLVEEHSRPRPESLPSTPSVARVGLPDVDGSSDGGYSEGGETTSVEESGASPTPHPAPTSPPAAEPQPASGLSQRGRLPPAMDVSMLQSLFMSKSQPSTPAVGPGRTQPLPAALAMTTGTPPAASSGETTRKRSNTNSAMDIYKSHDRSAPVPIRSRTSSHPDLKALMESYNHMPNPHGLKTTVWRQGDRPDPDGDYFLLNEEAGYEREKAVQPQYAFESPGYGFL